jgi:hypothetical protein
MDNNKHLIYKPRKAKSTLLRLLFIFLSITVLISCSSPINKKYNEETVEEDIIAIRSEIDSTKFKLLGGSIMRLKMQDKKLEEMTYAEILKEGEKWKAKNGKQKKKERKQNRKHLLKKQQKRKLRG